MAKKSVSYADPLLDAGSALYAGLRTGRNYDRDMASLDVVVDCSNDPGPTVQSEKTNCDINAILDRFMKTGVLSGSRLPPQFGDFSEVVSYQEALNRVAEAREAFMSLSPRVRSEFDNDPQKLMDFLADEDNRAKAEKLGLLEPRKAAQETSSADGQGDGKPPVEKTA